MVEENLRLSVTARLTFLECIPGSGDGAASTVRKAITAAKQKNNISITDPCRIM